jgi:hypothetical protein
VRVLLLKKRDVEHRISFADEECTTELGRRI